MKVGVVREVWRYPVKSMQGERHPALELVAASGAGRGFVGDRRFAIVAKDTNMTLTAKTVPQLLFASARVDGDRTIVRLPSGVEVPAADPGIDEALCTWLDRDVRMASTDEPVSTSYEMTFDPPNDEAELYAIPTPEGTFFDLMGVHALTTGSIATMAAAQPDTAWDTRRFRPNILVETEAGSTAPDAADAYPEDAWVGGVLRFGEGDEAASISVEMRAVRCAMPVRAQPGIERDVAVFRTMNAHHDNHLGIYCEPRRGGVVREGDAVHFEPTPPAG